MNILSAIVSAIVLFVALLFFALAIAAHGFALSTLWGWFVTPLFGAPALSIATAIGLYCVTRLFTIALQREEDKELEPVEQLKKSWKRFTTALLTPLLLLGIGWIARAFT
jgi:hypothetical protein